MAEYYINPFNGNRRREQRRSLWMIIADAAMWCFSAASVAALLLIFFGRFVSPEKMWYFSLLGLAAPIVYIAVILSMLYWIIRWKWAAVTFTGVFVMLGMFHVPLYYKLDLTKQYGEPSYDRTSIKMMTFNAHYFHNEQGEDTVDSIIRLVQAVNPDILCIQEFAMHQDMREKFDKAMSAYNCGTSYLENPGSHSIECFSKYRIIGARKIEDFGGTGNCLTADINIDDDTVRIYTAHMQTTSITSKDREYISHGEFISDSTRQTRFMQIAGALRQNNAIRAQQAELLRDEISQSPYPVILCGDFNDVPVSYTCRTASKGLYDTFSREGHMYAHTFRGFFNTLRIDYIFVSPYFQTVSYEVLPTGDLSDHYPVLARLKPTQK